MSKRKKPDSTAKKTTPKSEVPEGISEEGIKEMLPAGTLEMLDARIAAVAKAEIESALEAFKPEVAAAVQGAMERVIATARTAGVNIPGVPAVNPTTGLPEGGVVPGSPVTPMGAQLLGWITRKDEPSGMESLAKTLQEARLITDIMNPPSIWDRVMQNAVLRSLGKAGLVTGAEMKELLEPPAKGP